MSIREISASAIADAVEALVQEANFCLPEDVYKALETAKTQEESPLCQQVIGDLLENVTEMF